MGSSADNLCPQCESPIPDDAPGNVCPLCALRGTLAADSGNATPFEFADDVTLQEVPGRYTARGKEGEGGMGRVLLVRDEALGRDVVLKEMLPQKSPAPGDSSTRRTNVAAIRFLREAQITSQLDHPSIPPVYEVGERTDGTLYYTMKRVKGRTLSEAIERGGTLKERLELLPHFVDLCQAVAYAHDAGVVHRDLKPSNVMVGAFGETVVLDWGLAKTNDEPHELAAVAAALSRKYVEPDVDPGTVTGELIGSPLYMAPERARGDSTSIDRCTDVYSLGAILYQLLTGRPPFQWTTFEEVVDRVLLEEPQPVRVVIPAAPRELSAICRRAMAKDPGQRYASASELAEEITRFQNGAMVLALDYSVADRMGLFAHRYRYPLGGLAIGAAVLMVASAVYGVNIVRANRALETTNEALIKARNAEQVSKRNLEAQRDLALEAIDRLTFDVPNLVKDVPHTRPAVRTMLEDNVKLLDQIIELEPVEDSASIKRAANQEAIAERWRLLGDSQLAVEAQTEAVASYEKLVAALPNDTYLQTGLAWAHLRLSTHLNTRGRFQESTRHAVISRNIASPLLSHDPDSISLRSIVARSHYSEGLALLPQSRHLEAIVTLERSVEAYSSLTNDVPDDPGFRQYLALALRILGASNSGAGRESVALPYFEQSVQIFESLVLEFPTGKAYVRDLQSARNDLGHFYRTTGDHELAIATLLDSLDLAQALVDEDPSNADLRRKLAWAHNTIGSAYDHSGNHTEALEHLAICEKELRNLLSLDPLNTNHLMGLAMTLASTGRTHRQLKDYGNSIEKYLQSKEVWDALVTGSPDNAKYAQELAHCCSNLGYLYDKVDRTEDAIDAHRTALKHYTESGLATGFLPETHVRPMNNSHMLLMLLYRRNNREEEADQLRLDYLAFWRQLFEADPESILAGEKLYNLCLSAAKGLERANHTEKAKPLYEEALTALEQLVQRDPENETYQRAIRQAQAGLE